MQFTKTQRRKAGKRAPNTIDIDPSAIPGPKGEFAFIDENTIQLKLENGTTAVLFVAQGYSYTEVKPVEDALSAHIGGGGEVDDDDDEDDDEDEGQSEGPSYDAGEAAEEVSSIPGAGTFDQPLTP